MCLYILKVEFLRMTWYFVRTPFPWVLAISFGMGLLGLLEYKPEVVSHDALWLLGDLTRLLANDYPLVITLIWYPAVAAHIGEAIYAYRLAKSMVFGRFFTKFQKILEIEPIMLCGLVRSNLVFWLRLALLLEIVQN